MNGFVFDQTTSIFPTTKISFFTNDMRTDQSNSKLSSEITRYVSELAKSISSL